MVAGCHASAEDEELQHHYIIIIWLSGVGDSGLFISRVKDMHHTIITLSSNWRSDPLQRIGKQSKLFECTYGTMVSHCWLSLHTYSFVLLSISIHVTLPKTMSTLKLHYQLLLAVIGQQKWKFLGSRLDWIIPSDWFEERNNDAGEGEDIYKYERRCAGE